MSAPCDPLPGCVLPHSYAINTVLPAIPLRLESYGVIELRAVYLLLQAPTRPNLSDEIAAELRRRGVAL